MTEQLPADKPPMSLPLLCDLSRQELAEWCQAEVGQPYRAEQIRRWIFGKRANDFEVMTDISALLRKRLAETYALFASEIVSHQRSIDGTEKLLLEFRDGSHVECVLMREGDRRTICISTQVGCGMGCVFCASGMMGFKRNLSTGEILEQLLRMDRLLDPEERITNIVVMGMGEPMANLPNLLKALASLDEKGGMGIGVRRITISTVGLPDKIRELAALGRRYNLAVSLHAPNDALRNTLVPVNERIGIPAILAAADEYFDRTGRRVTYEYVVLRDVNDSAEQAEELGRLLKGRGAHINLIPMNVVSELPFGDPRGERLTTFVEILERHGVATTVRKRKGADIDAACGQLRLRHLQQLETANIP